MRLGEEPGNEAGEEPGNEAGEEPGNEAGEEPGNEAGEEPGNEAGQEPGNEAGENYTIRQSKVRSTFNCCHLPFPFCLCKVLNNRSYLTLYCTHLA